MAQVPNVNRIATNVRLSSDLKMQAALHAVKHGLTLSAFITQAIRDALAKKAKREQRKSRAFYRKHGRVIRSEPNNHGRPLCES